MEKNYAAMIEALNLATETNRQALEAQDATADAVATAIANGASWSAVGASLGLSKQTAYARYGKAERQERALEKWQAVMLELGNKQQQETEIASKKLNSKEPAKAKTTSKKSDSKAPAQREDALQAEQEMIYSGYVNTGMQIIDWKAEPDEAARKKCPYCEQTGHYNAKNGHWYVYRGCTLTSKDHAQHAANQTTAGSAK